jgi:uncharacterized protein YqgV (UPF0045/DUF77 family)
MDKPKRKLPRQGKKGARWLTPTEKANIVIAKELRGTTGKTCTDIAGEYGVALGTVQHIHEGLLPAEAKRIYAKKKKQLEELSIDTTLAALMKGKELILQADDPKHLSGIAALGKLSDTVYRLETNQPTDIQQTVSTETHALEFIKLLMVSMERKAALEAFLKADLAPLVPESRKLEIHKRIESGDLKLLNP